MSLETEAMVDKLVAKVIVDAIDKSGVEMTEKYVFDERTLCCRVGMSGIPQYDYVVKVATPDGKYTGLMFFDGPKKQHWFWRGVTMGELFQKAYGIAEQQIIDKIDKDNDLLDLKKHETTVFPEDSLKSFSSKDVSRVICDLVGYK